MNANPTSLILLAAALLTGPILVARAGADEPSTVRREARNLRPGTNLDDDQVRPLNGSRKPIPAIEQDVVLPEPRTPKHMRSADDEVVRPGGPTVKPDRALDDVVVHPGKTVKAAKRIPAQPGPAAAVRDRRNAAEDPAGRASESAKPSRDGKTEP